ncbi:MAG: type II toxin-antitoxin system RelE/ParE family toxin [Candidatus Berkelbacteria bacterium]|nr:type II toxin-antitoxin system RelE/ParE family toxin [Candidatus Berkelbacteria bacterium]
MIKSGDNLFFHPLVVRTDIPKLGEDIRRQIKTALETKLARHPETFGLPLRGILKKYWKLRVGNYRIVYQIEKNKIYIVAIAHRKEVYNISTRRI